MGLKQLPAMYAGVDVWGGMLSSLSHLDLSANQLNAVDVLAACTALTQLDVSSNDLDDLCVFLVSDLDVILACLFSRWHLCRVVDLRFSCRPSEFSSLSLLTSLSISTNKLVLVPSCIHHLTLLHTLRIANNTIQALPVALFGSLKNLEILDCQGNQVKWHHSTFEALALGFSF